MFELTEAFTLKVGSADAGRHLAAKKSKRDEGPLASRGAKTLGETSRWPHGVPKQKRKNRWLHGVPNLSRPSGHEVKSQRVASYQKHPKGELLIWTHAVEKNRRLVLPRKALRATVPDAERAIEEMGTMSRDLSTNVME